MRVVMAPDSFKGSLGAAAVADALAQGWRLVRPEDDVRTCPMADGGEGTIDAFEAANPTARRMPITVTGPDDQPVPTEFLRFEDGTAVIELAMTSGLGLTNRRRPLRAHTRGFGQAIAAALDGGAQRLIVAIGGSGSTDGGAGMLRELGARFFDAAGQEIGDGGIGLSDLTRTDLSGMRSLPPEGVTVLSDVTSPLLGPTGAAELFAQQKGASDDEVRLLDGALERLAYVVDGPANTPGAGAAGGTGYGLLVWGAQLALGADGVARAVGLPAAVADADLVVTGEGRFDGQSRYGKVPMYVLGLADELGRATCLVAGLVDAPADRFVASVSLVDLAGSARVSMANPSRYCQAAGRALAGLMGDTSL